MRRNVRKKQLTPKQEKFSQAVASGMSQADAYRLAFSVSATTKHETIYKRSSELMGRGDIAGRVQALRSTAAEKAQITLESHLRDLKALRNKALELKQISAAINAEVARGKAAGLYVERTELTGRDGAPIPVTSVPVADYLKARQKAIKEF
jgi:hypothetical protein